MKLRIVLMVLWCAMFVSAGHAQTKLPPETRNAALRYWLAFAELKDPPADPEVLESLAKTVNGQIPWSEEKLGKLLDANQESLGIFDRASKLPDCEWGLEYGQNSSGSIAYVPRARVLAKLNTLRGIREMAKGNLQVAMDAWLEGVHFSDQLTRGGSLIFGLVAKETMLPNLQWLTRATQSGRLNEKQKGLIAEQLKELPEDGVDWVAIWNVESAGIEQFLVKLQTQPKAEAEYQAMTGKAPLPGCVPPTPEEVKLFRDYLSDVRASFRLGEQEAKKRIESLEPTRKKLCVSEQSLIPSAQRTNEARLQLRAAKDGLQQALRGN